VFWYKFASALHNSPREALRELQMRTLNEKWEQIRKQLATGHEHFESYRDRFAEIDPNDNAQRIELILEVFSDDQSVGAVLELTDVTEWGGKNVARLYNSSAFQRRFGVDNPTQADLDLLSWTFEATLAHSDCICFQLSPEDELDIMLWCFVGNRM
jgi:hypothetical protein